MCTISGSCNLKKAYSLYKAGLERGNQSSGFIGVTNNNFKSLKQKDIFELDYLQEQMDSLQELPIYCLFHSRAPTNTTNQEFKINTTHPHAYKEWFVAQNGIIQNFESFPESKDFKTDSAIIPFHLHRSKGNISQVFSGYTGLLTSWIYNSLTNKIYLVKAGSSLHMSEDSFSSVAFEGSDIVKKDGIVSKFNGMGFEMHSTFEYSSPYFIL